MYRATDGMRVSDPLTLTWIVDSGSTTRTSQFYRVVTRGCLTAIPFHAMIPYVSGNAGGYFKGVESGESIETQKHDHLLGFVLMSLPHVIGGFHSGMRSKPSCFTRMTGKGSATNTLPTPKQEVHGAYSMPTNDTNPNTSESATKPALYCPCCGLLAKVDWQVDYVKGGGYWLITCLNNQRNCKIGEATASVGNIDNGTFLRAWKVEPQFDMRSGKVVA